MWVERERKKCAQFHNFFINERESFLREPASFHLVIAEKPVNHKQMNHYPTETNISVFHLYSAFVFATVCHVLLVNLCSTTVNCDGWHRAWFYLSVIYYALYAPHTSSLIMACNIANIFAFHLLGGGRDSHSFCFIFMVCTLANEEKMA